MTEEKKEGASHSKFDKIWEFLQTSGVIGAILLGARQPPKQGETLPGGKEVPGWLMSAFPSLTNEDEKEYNFALSSHDGVGARSAAEDFERNILAEGIYDEVKYRVVVVEIHREFMEQIRRPAPKDESGGRLKFAEITICNPFHEFMDRILAEKNAGGIQKEIFERQKQIALDRKLLEKIHLAKKVARWVRENKGKTLVSIFVIPFFVFSFCLFLLNLILN